MNVVVDSPIGRLQLRFEGEALASVSLTSDPVGDSHPTAERLVRVLNGSVDDLADVPVQLEGSAFQLAVWSALREIPPGTTTTYEALALAVDKGASHARAVGTAVGANPVPIVIPCHRVLPKSGKLGNYSLGGAEVKRRLLSLELRTHTHVRLL